MNLYFNLSILKTWAGNYGPLTLDQVQDYILHAKYDRKDCLDFVLLTMSIIAVSFCFVWQLSPASMLYNDNDGTISSTFKLDFCFSGLHQVIMKMGV